ncbi:MAG TPA: zf-HC2 domain-containing protein [Casimicrobiaceae bacterium]|nr:zf-HC2 domain-containing protein [Casimicrobiaceae bacterium]
MSSNVLPFDPSVHKVVDALLPWYVNGKLEARELAMVEQHVDHCARCRSEIEWLRTLHAACVSGARESGTSGPFNKLRNHLELRDAADVPVRRKDSARSPRWLRWAVAAQLAAIMVLGGAVWHASERPVIYRTLASPDSTAPRTGSLVVVFDPSTTEPELRRVLRDVGANIVSGPTPQGAYVIDVAPDRITDARDALRRERAVVLAEPLERSGGR